MDSLLMARIDQILEERNGRITNHELAQILNYDGSYIGRIVKKQQEKAFLNTVKAIYGLLFLYMAFQSFITFIFHINLSW